MRRLYLQIYLALVAILLLFSLLAMTAWYLAPGRDIDRGMLSGLGELAADLLPPPDASPEALETALARLAQQLGADLAVRGPDGKLLAAVGRPLPKVGPGRREGGRLRGRGPSAWTLRLGDGRWLVGRPDHLHGRGGAHALAALLLLAGAVALGAYPLVRRLTGRLERLRVRVDDLGAGDLSARVDVEGRDEVAALAQSFNHAAERIERLVGAQQTFLASVSHELRTPLTRMRLATELQEQGDRPELRERISRDIESLDELIGELLLASRLDARAGIDARESLDLLALVAEEAASFGAEVAGEPTSVRGEPHLLRHLVHNLLENAQRHAGGSDVRVEVYDGNPGAVLRVGDRGPGIPPEEHEAIFEPFYQSAARAAGSDRGVGLGLALVRRIARLHGGDATCREREGGGMCFEVRLES